MKLEAILAIAYVVIAFGTFTSVVIWALRRAGPDFPAEPATPAERSERISPAAPVKRAA
jgi:hypothetical protein